MDGRFTKSPMHKFIWFMIVALGNLLGAAVYFVWKRNANRRMVESRREAEIGLLAEAYRKTNLKAAEPSAPTTAMRRC